MTRIEGTPKEEQTPIISFARGLSALGDFVFRVELTTVKLIPRGIEVTHEKLAYQRAATIYDAAVFFSIDWTHPCKKSSLPKGLRC